MYIHTFIWFLSVILQMNPLWWFNIVCIYNVVMQRPLVSCSPWMRDCLPGLWDWDCLLKRVQRIAIFSAWPHSTRWSSTRTRTVCWVSTGSPPSSWPTRAFSLSVRNWEVCVVVPALAAAPDSEPLLQVTRGPNGLPVDPFLHRATDVTAVQLSEMMPLPVLMKHSVTTPLITQYVD